MKRTEFTYSKSTIEVGAMYIKGCTDILNSIPQIDEVDPDDYMEYYFNLENSIIGIEAMICSMQGELEKMSERINKIKGEYETIREENPQ